MTDIIKAFLTGGLICSLVQILLDRTKLMPGRVMVMLVVSGGILGWLGLYEPFAEWPEPGHQFLFLVLEIRCGRVWQKVWQRTAFWEFSAEV